MNVSFNKVGAAGMLVILAMAGSLGCSAPREESEEAPALRRTPVVEQNVAGQVNLDLIAPDDDVRTIQLYAEDEASLPILALRSGQKLTLEFDLMDSNGRPLSVYFYHADREWDRDLISSEYMTSFSRDDLFDYQLSRGTQVDYAHYTYTFPSSSIGFQLSGNYILRVTEQGREDEVLFERPFFVTEQAAALQFGIDNVMVGQGYPSAQPILQFSPPSTQGNVFDYNVCFVQNGRFEGTRCSTEASLTRQPDLLFYLEPENAFSPAGADYFVDLGSLRVGGQIEAVDLSVTPYEVLVEPDYQRFPASDIDPLLNGQAVVEDAVQDVGDPDTAGEYVESTFRFVPDDEQRFGGPVYITGSFNSWSFDLQNEMDWVAEQGRYEKTILIKQGQYEYRYTSPDARVRQELRNPLPRAENQYAAFVYFSDTRYQTDRLLATQSIRAR